MRPPYFDGQYPVLNLEEVIIYLQDLNRKYPHANRIGLNIELKSADQYLNEFGIDVSKRLYTILKKHNMHTRRGAVEADLPIIIQSFHYTVMKYFKTNPPD